MTLLNIIKRPIILLSLVLAFPVQAFCQKQEVLPSFEQTKVPVLNEALRRTRNEISQNLASIESLETSVTALQAAVDGVYVGSLTRDTTAASEDVPYTGVGFQPDLIFFIAAESATSEASWGADDGTTSASISANRGSAAVFGTNTSSSIYAEHSTGNVHSGVISSFDTDGFTITWTKTGSPSGTLTVIYIAIKL